MQSIQRRRVGIWRCCLFNKKIRGGEVTEGHKQLCTQFINTPKDSITIYDVGAITDELLRWQERLGEMRTLLIVLKDNCNRRQNLKAFSNTLNLNRNVLSETITRFDEQSENKELKKSEKDSWRSKLIDTVMMKFEEGNSLSDVKKVSSGVALRAQKRFKKHLKKEIESVSALGVATIEELRSLNEKMHEFETFCIRHFIIDKIDKISGVFNEFISTKDQSLCEAKDPYLNGCDEPDGKVKECAKRKPFKIGSRSIKGGSSLYKRGIQHIFTREGMYQVVSISVNYFANICVQVVSACYDWFFCESGAQGAVAVSGEARNAETNLNRGNAVNTVQKNVVSGKKSTLDIPKTNIKQVECDEHNLLRRRNACSQVTHSVS